MASIEPCAANLFGTVTNGWPVSMAISAAILGPKSGKVLRLRPVPPADPPPLACTHPPSAVSWLRLCIQRVRERVVTAAAGPCQRRLIRSGHGQPTRHPGQLFRQIGRITVQSEDLAQVDQYSPLLGGECRHRLCERVAGISPVLFAEGTSR